EPEAGLGTLLPKRQPRTPSLSFGDDSDDSADTGSFTSPFAASQPAPSSQRAPSSQPAPSSEPVPILPTRASQLPEPEQVGIADPDGLPVRVRQANLAPQLRELASQASAQQFVAAPEMPADSDAPSTRSAVSVQPDPPVSEVSPEAARNFMSALQRGWERGRSMAQQITEETDREHS